MNYLGHAYFSFNHPDVLVGNMISDFVKGKRKFDYPADIQKGIQLHRWIDDISDSHEATRRGKEIFKPQYRLYAGAIMDVIYDYFIANDNSLFQETSLFAFSQQTYQKLEAQQHWFPEKFAFMFPFMKEQNWLYNYRLRQGIQKSLGGLVRRAAYLIESEIAFQLFEENMDLLQECYNHFSAGIKPALKNKYEELINE